MLLMENKNEQNKLTDDQILKSWYRKRRNTTFIIFFEKCLNGFEYSAIGISALYYFKLTIKADNPKFYYSIAVAAMFMVASFATLFGGRYIDRTRKCREYLLGSIVLTIIGNLIYVLSFSKWLPIIGRALCGVADGAKPGFQGEISRSYSSEETSVILSNLQIAMVIFHALAPVSPVLFANINFKLFGIVEINQYNFIGLFEACMALLLEIMAYFFFTNLTKDEGYKIYLQRNRNDDNSEEIIGVESRNENLLTFRNVSTNIDIMTIIVHNLLFFIIFGQTDLVINMVAVLNFQWSITRLSIVTIIGVVTSVILMKVIQQKLTGGKNTYFLFTCSIIGLWLALILLLVATNFTVTNIYQQTLIIFFSFLLNIIPGYSCVAWSLVLIYFIVPAHSRSFVSGLRFGAAKLGCMFGYFVAAFAYSNSVFLYPTLIVCCFILTVFVLVRRTRFFDKYNVFE